MEMVEFTVLGKPTAQPRHRMAGKFNYDPAKHLKQDFAVVAQLNAPSTPWVGALRMNILAVFPRPKNHYRTGKRAGELKRKAPQRYTPKGRNDWDNIAKFVCDAINGIYYEDDGQIAIGKVTKIYGTKPRTEVTIWKLEP